MKNLNKVLFQQGISSKELCLHLDISESLLSRFKNGERLPNSEMLLKMSHYLETSIDYLLNNPIVMKEECCRKLEEIEEILHG